jgi:hypothetical protein
VRLSLLHSDLQTTDFGFERRNMTDCPDSNATKLISATTCFDEFARVFVSRSPFFALFGCLTARSGGLGECRRDTHGDKRKLSCGGSGGVTAREHRHRRHSWLTSGRY